MSEEKLVPKLRFSGFTDEWNEVTLNDVATFSKGKGISKNDISNYGIECVRYGELYTKYNEMIYNIESKTDLNKNELKLSEKNDILMPCSGETAIDLATASCIQKDQVAIGGDITVIKTNQYAPFITYYLNQKKTEIAKYAQGVSIVHLYPKDFKVMNIRIPSINEQKMIIGLLEEITKKEQLLESKYQQYQEFKKYLMQQIFTQKLRFDFNDEWKNIPFKKLLKEVNEKTTVNNQHEILSSTKEGIFTQKDYFADRNVASKDNTGYKVLRKNQIVLSPQNLWMGNINVNTEFDIGIVSPSYKIYETTDLIDINYFKHIVKLPRLIYEYTCASEQGASIVRRNLNKQLFNEITIKVPSLNEQKKIGNLFDTCDEKIKNIDKNIQDMKEFKKGLLQQMFVVQLILSLLQNKKHI